MTGTIPFSIVIQCYSEGEAGDAQLFAHLYHDRVVFDHSRHEWYLWATHFWKVDIVGSVYNLITHKVAAEYLEAAAEAKRQNMKNTEGNDFSDDLIKRAGALRNRRRVDNILFLAAKLPGIALAGDEWDRDPWLLAVENGVLDLKTGQLNPGRPRDFIHYHAALVWNSLDELCPQWEKFINEVFNNDIAIIEFIQKLHGYAITGLTIENILPIEVGEGRNGKTTKNEVLLDLLGSDYAMTADADTLMDTKKTGDGPKPFVYALRGKRLACTKESNEGVHINAGLVKQLTGGDTLTVRDMYSRPVTFTPTHLVLLSTNNKPHMSAEDTALWDRVILIPYDQRFVDNPDPLKPNEHKQDKLLKQKLLSEKSGILAWLVRGCLEWQKTGLGIPVKLKDATKQYRDDEDSLKNFIDECCLINNPNFYILAGDLYKEYKQWSFDNGISPMSNTAFGLRMKKRYQANKCGKITYTGITLSNHPLKYP